MAPNLFKQWISHRMKEGRVQSVSSLKILALFSAATTHPPSTSKCHHKVVTWNKANKLQFQEASHVGNL
jgi:hypothetical protein